MTLASALQGSSFQEEESRFGSVMLYTPLCHSRHFSWNSGQAISTIRRASGPENKLCSTSLGSYGVIWKCSDKVTLRNPSKWIRGWATTQGMLDEPWKLADTNSPRTKVGRRESLFVTEISHRWEGTQKSDHGKHSAVEQRHWLFVLMREQRRSQKWGRAPVSEYAVRDFKTLKDGLQIWTPLCGPHSWCKN